MTTLHPDLEALMPKPYIRRATFGGLYTATQMREAILAATERAAKVAEDTDVVDVQGPNSYYCQLGDAAATRDACAAAIRGGGGA